MSWWIWILILLAGELFFLYAAPPLVGLASWILLKRYLGGDFQEETAAFLADDDKKFCQLLFYRFAEKNLSLHWEAMRAVRKLITLGVASDFLHGPIERAIQRAIDNPILPPNQPLQNFVSVGDGDLLCDSKWGSFVVAVPGAEGLRRAKTREERDAVKKLRRAIRRQKLFIFVVKKILPCFLPVETRDLKVEGLL